MGRGSDETGARAGRAAGAARAGFLLRCGIVAAALAAGGWAVAAGASTPPAAVTVAVAAFDNDDTAGESAERTAAHAARVDGFDELLGAAFGSTGPYRTVRIACPAGGCSATTARPEALIAAARAAGARILVYGGIHKMSTLVQIGKIQAVDLSADRLLIDRLFTFRGDTDAAFARAADFMARQVDEAFARP
ncbi:hypothetical protein OHA_1_04319 [Pleomorphomonas sp. SM30]|uniref:Uncharacterized protein DUF2380 n=1 Tax=Oharaeibacter diazotrophicus TaxID=1920512 RepID=A0A4R6RM34_9HYPH|nr:DUF2380 domain-containing protein [Oharaeibacter diazotrophicus]TDP87733.1 uncharacterized protein DUF2380 [Oharaeibacter diazotrophicus]BBE74685.1 hypothetical protein OHA_1_04319 [Pleomorphomonas sp. SM30]GLS77065.1 hypothetical protein GCM10007904_24020 [Oharaeibacter diazotrophicus]